MTQERFLEILEAYGADPARWPEAEREAAQAYADAHPDLVAQAIETERQLDALLGPAEAEVSPLLEARILRQAPQPKPAVFEHWRLTGAVAAAVLVAVTIGFGSNLIGAEPADEDYFYDDFAGLEDDWTDWLGEEDA